MANTNFQPAPTWADPMLEQTDPKTGEKKTIFNPVWLKWFVDLTANVPASGAGGGSGSVVGPALAISGNVALFNGATGQLLKDGGTLGTSAFTATATPTTLGLVIGTNVQAYNANLTAINQALTTTSSPSFTTVTAALTGHASLDLPLTGGTLTGNLLFTDATYDIGASGATRPRNLFLSGSLTAGAGSFTTGLFSGNVGIGGAPSAWYSGSSFFVMQQAGGAALYSYLNGGVNPYGGFGINEYIDGAFTSRFIGTGYAGKYEIIAGTHNFGISSASGTAGGAISFNTIASISSTGLAVTGMLSGTSTITTANPGLGAGAWKLGQVESGIGLALNTTSYIQIMVDGAAVKLAQVL